MFSDRLARRVRGGVLTALTRAHDRLSHETMSPSQLLETIYSPPRMEQHDTGKLVLNRVARVGDQLPVPPTDLRMSHAAADDEYLASGARSAAFIRTIAQRENVDLKGAKGLDWGCATGRVLRHFEAEARDNEWWGADAHGDSLEWAKANLHPPFRFVTATSIPHLPFEDNTFRVVYAGSVLTHIVHLLDMWLMELRRIMEPGGIALLSIQDEHSRQWLAERPDLHAEWRSRGWASERDLTGGLHNDVEVTGDRRDWGGTVTWFRDDFVRREWGQYLDVVSIEPFGENYQSVVVLKK